MSLQIAVPAGANLGTVVSHGPRHSLMRRTLALGLASLGVVFGDIGTSPLYAFRQALNQTGAHVTGPAVVGVCSLAIWALILVVTVKYVIFLMRADNRGEGGVLSLMALAQHALGRRTLAVFALGLCGAGLFFGDALITPAMSVLSAVEGVQTVPGLGMLSGIGFTVSASIAILVLLFLAQAKGVARVATLFGPVMLVWFAAIALVGLPHILRTPQVLEAFSPLPAIALVGQHGMSGLLVLGAVFLTVTGAEALYADMGHFGRTPIQLAWLFVAFPALIINYLGQGALALHTIASSAAPVGDTDWFFMATPQAVRAPMVIIALVATVIASQAVITGAFSLSHQAMQLGLLPRMITRRTSEAHSGQIYVPRVNFMLLVGVVLLIAVFKTSGSFANAYGLAVTGTMAVTTSLAFVVVRRQWRWSLLATLLLIAPLLGLDLVFLGANALKFLSGGFVPVLLAAGLIGIMTVWVRGRAAIAAKGMVDRPELRPFVEMLAKRPPRRVAGTAVYLSESLDLVPGALLHNLKHNHVLHEHNLILTVEVDDQPHVCAAERVRVEPVGESFAAVHLRYGFMQSPNIPRALQAARSQGLGYEPMATSFFLGRRTIVAGARSPLSRFGQKLFILLSRNAADPTDVFHLPPSRVVEMGTQVAV